MPSRTAHESPAATAPRWDHLPKRGTVVVATLLLCIAASSCALSHDLAAVAAPQAAPGTPTAPGGTAQWEPGGDLRVYSIGAPLARVPDLLEGQTPNFNVKIAAIDLDGKKGSFGDLTDHFYTTVTGRLHIQASGSYKFRLTSDDGSILSLNGSVLLNHDGLHGATSLEGAIDLTRGYAALELRHFENGGDDTLRLEWQQPGETQYSVVTDEHLSTPAGWVRVTSPGHKKVRGPSDPPGDGRPLTGVHPAYEVRTARPAHFHPKVGGMDFLPDGRLILCTWDEHGSVHVLDRVDDGIADEITVSTIASGLAEPLGLCVVEDRIFVLQKQELTELIDRDGDGTIDEFACLNAEWSVTANFHEFAFGLVHHEGWLYFNLAIAIDPGGKSTQPQAPDRGRTARVEIATGELEFLTTGLRTPNGIGRAEDGSIYLTDNQGDWLPCSKLLHLRPGAFYGSPAALPAGSAVGTVTPPVVWMPQNEIGNSPGEVIQFRDGPFAGQLGVCDVTHGGIKRVFVEEVAGVRQGALFRCTQGLEAGINRMKSRADGVIFVGGIGSGGNWGQAGKLKYGLQQLQLTAGSAFEMLAVRIHANGFEVTLTEPIDPGSLPAAEAYQCQFFRYVPTAEYGGPKRDLREATPESVTLSADRSRLFFEFAELPTDHVFYLRLPRTLRSESHKALWSTETWYTINRVPAADASPRRRAVHPKFAPAPVVTHNQLRPAEQAAGWQLLFDGTSTSSWRGYKQANFPDQGWVAEGGTLKHHAGGGGGDIITVEQYENFDFECEWRIAAGGNSGIIYLVNEGDGATWSTGPEMQVLDDYRWQPDPATAAGALYDLVPCHRDVSRPAGEWNHARVKVIDRHVEHWLNGVRVVSIKLESPEWQRRLAASKFASMPGFAKARRGHIALQDHGDQVEYRNLKIRRLDGGSSNQGNSRKPGQGGK